MQKWKAEVWEGLMHNCPLFIKAMAWKVHKNVLCFLLNHACNQSNCAMIKLSSLHHRVDNYTWVLHRKKNMLGIFIIQRWFIVISLINQSPPLEDWRKNIKFSVPVTQPLPKNMSQRPESVLEKEKNSLPLH